MVIFFRQVETNAMGNQLFRRLHLLLQDLGGASFSIS